MHETKDGYIEVEAVEIYQLRDSPEPSSLVDLVYSALLEKNGHPCSKMEVWQLLFGTVLTYSGLSLNYHPCHHTNNFFFF